MSFQGHSLKRYTQNISLEKGNDSVATDYIAYKIHAALYDQAHEKSSWATKIMQTCIWDF